MAETGQLGWIVLLRCDTSAFSSYKGKTILRQPYLNFCPGEDVNAAELSALATSFSCDPVMHGNPTLPHSWTGDRS